MKADLTCRVCGSNLGRMFSGEMVSERRKHIRTDHPELWAEYERIKAEAHEFYKKTGVGITWA